MKRISLVILIIFSAIFANAQRTKLSGKVTNNKNEALASVTVSLKSDKTIVSKTDVEGRYNFNIDINKEYTLVFNYVGYKEKSITVKASSTEEFIADVLLDESGKKLTDVVVSATRSSNKGAT
ncbi:MAG: carboxypeptidase-like regulatory domain-containing protein, partial [Chitinophagaceae bacterium]